MNKKYLWIIPLLLGGFILYNLTTQDNAADIEEGSSQVTARAEDTQKKAIETPSAVSLVVNPDPSVNSVKRVGVDITLWSSWGAEQLMKNKLQFYASGTDSKAKNDDVYLGFVQEGNSAAFRQEAINMLKKLKPSYMRAWQGELTDTSANSTADPSTGKSHLVREQGDQGSQSYPYSLPETLDLVEIVGARPWLVIPASLNDEEASQLGKWLAENASKERFIQVVLEVGINDSLSQSGETTYPESYEEVADRIIRKIEEGAKGKANLVRAGSDKMNKPLPGISSESAQDSNGPEMISGTTLAKQILLYMYSTTHPVVVPVFPQNRTKTLNNQDQAQLSEVYSDVGSSNRSPPMGHTIKMLNNVINGSMHEIHTAAEMSDSTEKLTMAAFRYGTKWTAAVASESPDPIYLQITFPEDTRQIPTWMDVLTEASPIDGNEVEEQATIQRQNIQSIGRTVTLTVPPYGFIVLNTNSSKSVKISKGTGLDADST